MGVMVAGRSIVGEMGEIGEMGEMGAVRILRVIPLFVAAVVKSGITRKIEMTVGEVPATFCYSAHFVPSPRPKMRRIAKSSFDVNRLYSKFDVLVFFWAVLSAQKRLNVDKNRLLIKSLVPAALPHHPHHPLRT
ncbi:hypothetical protein ALMA_0309 [Alloscardovia macacae]|uniref:Uncharacterized protein n=1 Tax=Alloscardovia macacae TaxID=1160091 RepID=A0A261F7B6_9BIFI|nr:hypothetical protein ALMA_0309 [Alloscardovia macacae]